MYLDKSLNPNDPLNKLSKYDLLIGQLCRLKITILILENKIDYAEKFYIETLNGTNGKYYMWGIKEYIEYNKNI